MADCVTVQLLYMYYMVQDSFVVLWNLTFL